MFAGNMNNSENGQSSGQRYSLQDYAPIDPLNNVFGFPQAVQQQSASQQGQQPGPSNVARHTQPSTSSHSQSGQNRSHPDRPAVQIQQQYGVRNLSTAEYRRDYERAAPYIPTPINGPSTNTASSAPQPYQHQAQNTSRNIDQASSNRPLATHQQQQQHSHRPSNSSSRGQSSSQPVQQQGSNTANNSTRASVKSGSAQNSSFNIPPQNVQRIVPPFPAPHNIPPGINVPPQIPGMVGNGAQRICMDPEIDVFSPPDPRWNTHLVFKNRPVTITDFANHVRINKMKIDKKAAVIIKSRLPPNDPDHIPFNDVSKHLRECEEMMRAEMQFQTRNPPIVPIPTGHFASQGIPPNIANIQGPLQARPTPQMMQQNPRAISHIVPPGIPHPIPPHFLQQHQQNQIDQSRMTREQIEHHQNMQRHFAMQQQHNFSLRIKCHITFTHNKFIRKLNESPLAEKQHDKRMLQHIHHNSQPCNNDN
uniref:GLTSCR1 domain-containing protein n=1 Tax=Caenorhabditis tropicalis TaxID=1561998 RepID=A0A1I7TML3_9PELO